MWRLKRYFLHEGKRRNENFTLNVERYFYDNEEGKATKFNILTNDEIYTQASITEKLVKDFPRFDWLQLHADNMFWAIETYREHNEIKRLTNNCLIMRKGNEDVAMMIKSGIADLRKAGHNPNKIYANPKILDTLLAWDGFMDATTLNEKQLVKGAIGKIDYAVVIETVNIPSSDILIVDEETNTSALIKVES